MKAVTAVKLVEISEIPDGVYQGVLSGDKVRFDTPNGAYGITIDTSFRTAGSWCKVSVDNGEINVVSDKENQQRAPMLKTDWTLQYKEAQR